VQTTTRKDLLPAELPEDGKARKMIQMPEPRTLIVAAAVTGGAIAAGLLIYYYLRKRRGERMAH
jgi:hypothetical protein